MTLDIALWLIFGALLIGAVGWLIYTVKPGKGE